MRTVLDIAFGITGQRIYFDVPEGRPSVIYTCEVFSWTSSDDSPVLSASGAIESNPNTTTDNACGSDQSDPTAIYVTASTGFEIDRNYLITNPVGVREWFECAGIESGATVTARHPLHNAYAVGSTVQSTRIYAVVDSTWVADEQNIDPSAGPNPAYRVRWSYAYGGSTYVADSYFCLVRYPGKHGVRPQDVELTHPGWLDRLPTDHRKDQGRRLIDEAYRAVKIDLHAILTADESVANTEIVDELTRWKCLEAGELARIMSGGGSSESYAAARIAYQTRFDSLARITVKVPIRDSTGSASARSPLGLTRR